MKKRSQRSGNDVRAVQYAVVVSRFNEAISDRLLRACLDEFARHGVSGREIRVVKVPGAFEIPVVALTLAQKKNIRAVICLGAVIKGQTFHYELVAQACARGAQEASLRTGKPVIFEVLAAETVSLCEERSREGDRDNKGASAARVAVEMVEILKNI